VRARLARRLTATGAAALAVVLAVPAGPVARAQPDDRSDGVADSGPTPPPLGTDRTVPKDDGKPDLSYTQKTDRDCIGTKTGQVTPQTIPWGQKVLQFKELHQFATGAGQTVAVIDTGVNPHDFLGRRLSGGGDYVQRNGTGLNDCDGHGTEVAGVIAADPNDDSIGFQGIAYGAKIVSIRQSSDSFEYRPPNGGKGALDKAGSLTTLAKAVVNAAKRNVDVINMSVDTCRLANTGNASPITPAEIELQRALRYAYEDKDVVLVASAGNIPSGDCDKQNNADPKHPRFIVSPPWFSEYVLSVAATQQDGTVAGFSMNGPWVSVAAPGTNIISLAPGDRTSLANLTPDPVSGQLGPIQGTSFAAPYVSGLAALVRERFEKLGRPLTAAQVADRIKRTAAHPAGPGGRNSEIGYGMVNPIAALTEKLPGQDVPTDHAVQLPFSVPKAEPRDWTPEQVALIGSAGGLGLLLLTVFIVHTVRRQRRDRTGPA
jgi:membrane-anchored mycosin MYCP